MRTALLLIATAATYALLRGWPESWHVILRISFAGTLILLALVFWGFPVKSLHSSFHPVAHAARRPRFTDLLGIVVTLLLIECFLMVFLALAPAQSEKLAVSLQEVLADRSEAREVITQDSTKQTSSGARAGTFVTSNWLFSGPGPRRINKNREVRPTNRPEVYLYPKTPRDAQILLTSRRFLRNFTLSTYRDGAWFPSSIVPQTLSANDNLITRPASTPGRPVSYDISHQANLGKPTLAITVPNFIAMAQPALREIAPDTYRLPPLPPGEKSYRYGATSIPFDLSKASAIVPGESPASEYLALPADPALRSRLQALATSFGPPSRPSLEALRKHLETQCRYSLSPEIPDEADPIESFLFGTQSGYCSHFASATVLLTRAMGIPSRLGFGWSGGRYFEGPGFFVFRAREAHTWAEIYLRDQGWVIFETTPSSRNEGSPSLAPPEEPPPFPDDYRPPEAGEPDPGEPLAPLLKASLWTGTLALATLLVGFLFHKKRQIPMDSPSPDHLPLPETPHYLAAFRQTCLALGSPMPPGRTLRDHLERIEAPAFAGELLDYHYGVQYGDRRPEKRLEKKFLRQLREWGKKDAP